MWTNPFLTGVPCPPPVLPQAARAPGFHVLSPTESLSRLGVPMTDSMPQTFPLFCPRIQFPGVPATVPIHNPLQAAVGLPQTAMMPHHAWNVTYLSPYTPLTLTSGNTSTSSASMAVKGNVAVSEKVDTKLKTSGTMKGPLSAIDLELEKINNVTGMGRQTNEKGKEGVQESIHDPHSSLASSTRKRVQSPPIFGGGFLISSPKAASTPLKPTDQEAPCQKSRKVTKTKSKPQPHKHQSDSNFHSHAGNDSESSPTQPLDLRINKGSVKRRVEDSISESVATPMSKRVKKELSGAENALEKEVSWQTPTHAFRTFNKSMMLKSSGLNGKRRRSIQHQNFNNTDHGRSSLPLSNGCESRSLESQPMDFSGLSVNKENVVPIIKQEKAVSGFIVNGSHISPTSSQLSFGSLTKSVSSESESPSAVHTTFDSGITHSSSLLKHGLGSSYLTPQSVVDSCFKDGSNPDDSGLSKTPRKSSKGVESSNDRLTTTAGKCFKNHCIESKQESMVSTASNNVASCPNSSSIITSDSQTGRYKCSYPDCPSVFTQMKLLNSHCRNTHGEKSFRCTFDGCGKSFATRSTLRHHQFVHTDTFKCTWPNCGKRFRDDYNLRTHYMIHTGKKPRQCHLCDYACVQKNSMDWHMKTKHSDQ